MVRGFNPPEADRGLKCLVVGMVVACMMAGAMEFPFNHTALTQEIDLSENGGVMELEFENLEAGYFEFSGEAMEQISFEIDGQAKDLAPGAVTESAYVAPGSAMPEGRHHVRVEGRFLKERLIIPVMSRRADSGQGWELTVTYRRPTRVEDWMKY